MLKAKTFKRLVLLAGLCISGLSQAALIGTSTGGLYDLDVSTNTSTFIGNMGVTMFDIASDSTILYGVSSSGRLYSVNTSTAAATLIGSTGASINGLAFDSSGTLYGTGGSNLYTINTTSGLATLVGGNGGGFRSAGDIAFDLNDNLFMSATSGELVALNTATGAGTSVFNTGYREIYGLDFEGSELYGFTSGGQTLKLDTTNKLATVVASNGLRAFGADGIASVNAPSALALLGLGLIGIAGMRTQRR